MYFDEFYNFCFENFAKLCVLAEINAKRTMIFMFFLWFHHESQLIDNFHYHIRNQRVKIHKCGDFEGNRWVQLFETLSKSPIGQSAGLN